MKKNKKTYYLLILDKSGSMGSIIPQTVAGFNEQVQMIRKLKPKYPAQIFLEADPAYDWQTGKIRQLDLQLPGFDTRRGEHRQGLEHPGTQRGLF